MPSGSESFYNDSNFDILNFYGFVDNQRRLDAKFTTNPSLDSVNEVLEKNPQFSVAEEIIAPAVRNVLDKYEVSLSKLFHNKNSPIKVKRSIMFLEMSQDNLSRTPILVMMAKFYWPFLMSILGKDLLIQMLLESLKT